MKHIPWPFMWSTFVDYCQLQPHTTVCIQVLLHAIITKKCCAQIAMMLENVTAYPVHTVHPIYTLHKAISKVLS